MLGQVDPSRIHATVLRLTQFGTRHTASGQTGPVRGIGAATAWVFQQMQAIATTSSGRMTVQQQTFVQPVSNRIPVPTTITNVIATLAQVAKVNAAALWALATSPGTPKNVQIHVVAPPNLAGTNLTTLTWNANPEPNLAGYQVVTRETTSPGWTDAINVRNEVISVKFM